MSAVFVTGGAGFIGSALVRLLLAETPHLVVNIDKLTYAGNLASLDDCAGHPRHAFSRIDVCDRAALDALFARHRPVGVVHLAAESHVDRSIRAADDFVRTNVVGTFTLLEAARTYWNGLPGAERADFRFHHVSTDEVFGSLEVGAFAEDTPYDPHSPYSASKAAADHLVRAWHRTYGFPALVTNCSNNYGPRQFPEKLIPVTILNALAGKPLPIYGNGEHVRDWLYVEDHARALQIAFERGQPGATYCIGGRSERRNREVVDAVCAILDRLKPRPQGSSHRQLKTFVADRPGHDRRYAIDSAKIERELGWRPQESFDSGLQRTVEWYLQHPDWVAQVRGARQPGSASDDKDRT